MASSAGETARAAASVAKESVTSTRTLAATTLRRRGGGRGLGTARLLYAVREWEWEDAAGGVAGCGAWRAATRVSVAAPQ